MWDFYKSVQTKLNMANSKQIRKIERGKQMFCFIRLWYMLEDWEREVDKILRYVRIFMVDLLDYPNQLNSSTFGFLVSDFLLPIAIQRKNLVNWDRERKNCNIIV